MTDEITSTDAEIYARLCESAVSYIRGALLECQAILIRDLELESCLDREDGAARMREWAASLIEENARELRVRAKQYENARMRMRAELAATRERHNG